MASAAAMAHTASTGSNAAGHGRPLQRPKPARRLLNIKKPADCATNRFMLSGVAGFLRSRVGKQNRETLRPLLSQISSHSNLPGATPSIACSRQGQIAGLHNPKANRSIERFTTSTSGCPQLNHLQSRIGSVCQKFIAKKPADSLSTIFSQDIHASQFAVRTYVLEPRKTNGNIIHVRKPKTTALTCIYGTKVVQVPVIWARRIRLSSACYLAFWDSLF
jgi:hypothetical protein